MSTHAVIYDPKALVGRYVHHDGYPRACGQAVFQYVEEHGVEAARKHFVHDHKAGWSAVLPEQDFGLIPASHVPYPDSDGPQDCEQWDHEWSYTIEDDGLRVYHASGVEDVIFWDHEVDFAAYQTALEKVL